MTHNIYAIIHQEKVIYIGQTNRPISYRLAEHMWCAKNNKKNQPKLFHKLRKHEYSGFNVWLLESHEDNKLADDVERFWIQFYNTIEDGCNQDIGGLRGGRLGSSHSIETKNKLSKAWTPERKAAASKRMSSRIITEETKEKQRDLRKGVPLTGQRKIDQRNRINITRSNTDYSAKMKQVWEKRRAGLIPMPRSGG